MTAWSVDDAWQCQEAVVRFTCHFDAGEYAQMEQYFARDGVWVRSEGELRGTEQLRAFLAERGSRYVTRHLLGNLRCTPLGDGRAAVDSYVTAYRVEPAGAAAPFPLALPFMVGRYRDELVHEDGAWRIARRTTHTDFKS